MINFEIKIFSSLTEELKEDWQEFEKKSFHHIFQTFRWQKLWLEKQIEYKNDVQNYTILVYENKKLIMILPFNIRSKFSIKTLSWSGFPFSDYNIPLMIKGKELSKDEFIIIWKLILDSIQNCDCIVLNNQPEKILYQNNPFYNFLDNKINNQYYGIKFNQEFELKKKEIENIRYQINRLKKIGKLNFKIAKDKDEKKKILDFIVQHKSKQYINTNAWNLYKQKKNKDFFLSSNLIMEEKSYITYLQINNEIIAAHSGYVYKNICYYLFPVYNINYHKYSPGKILLKKIIDDSKLNSLDYFDLTIGDEDYKKSYSNNKFYSATALQAVNIKGNLYILLLRFKMILKKFLKRSKILN